VYTGGSFTTIGGQTRNRIATLDATTGLATAWDPNSNSNVNALAVNGATVYAGGIFTTMGGEPIASFAVFPAATLPLHFVSFTATARRDVAASVLCKWSTAEEQNTSHFMVERSADGIYFSGIGMVAATGNTSPAVQSYSFTDNNPLASTAWYRIKQVDRDGAATYSKIIAVAVAGNTNTIRLFPNPVQQDATLMITLGEKEYVGYTIFDQNGRRIVTSFLYLDKGSNSISLPVQMLIKGTYVIKVKGTKTNTQLQFVKQ
jgi:hypothetical protein